jgi:hypothetical protein
MLRFPPRYLLLALLATGCSPRGEAPAIGEGFVAPATLNLRKELGPRQPSVASVEHGERVEILARRRRFVEVRTRSGAVGWTDGALLFTPEQMDDLRALGQRAGRLPGQGEATVLDALNVHTEPDRQSASFHQVKEGEHVTVVEHRLVSVPPRTEDWTLVRISGGRAGWVLTRNLVMAIPDEVAQYAEGHRITSYFPLGEATDNGQVKRDWLWTTITKGLESYEFDSARVFVWSLRRHHYETAFIEKNLKGYYPVEVNQQAGSPVSFSLIVEEKDGKRYTRTYAFQGYHVRLTAKAPWAAAPGTDSAPASPAARQAQARKPWLTRIGEQLAEWRRRLLRR